MRKKCKLITAIEVIEDICEFIYTLGFCGLMFAFPIYGFITMFCTAEIVDTASSVFTWYFIIAGTAFCIHGFRDIFDLRKNNQEEIPKE